MISGEDRTLPRRQMSGTLCITANFDRQSPVGADSDLAGSAPGRPIESRHGRVEPSLPSCATPFNDAGAEQSRHPVSNRHQFRTYAEFCLRAAELSDAPEQKESLVATANAWHQLAQKLEMRDKLT